MTEFAITKSKIVLDTYSCTKKTGGMCTRTCKTKNKNDYCITGVFVRDFKLCNLLGFGVYFAKIMSKIFLKIIFFI